MIVSTLKLGKKFHIIDVLQNEKRDKR